MYVCTYKKIDVPCFMGTVSASVPACVHPDWAASTKHHLFNMNSATLSYQREYILCTCYDTLSKTELRRHPLDGRTDGPFLSLSLSVSLSLCRVVAWCVVCDVVRGCFEARAGECRP